MFWFFVRVGVVLGVFLSPAFALHGSWMDKYLGRHDVPCCGAKDCQEVFARILVQKQDVSVVEINGVILSIENRVIHVSEDGHDWYCRVKEGIISAENTRCFFIAVRA